MPMEVEVAQFLVGNEPPKSTHAIVIDITFFFSYGMAIMLNPPAPKEPQTDAGFTHVTHVVDEIELGRILLRAIHGGQPPVAISSHKGDKGRDVMIPNERVR